MQKSTNTINAIVSPIRVALIFTTYLLLNSFKKLMSKIDTAFVLMAKPSNSEAPDLALRQVTGVRNEDNEAISA
jgi:hypothetical protein